MIQLKKNCEIVLIDKNAGYEELELVDVLSLKDNALCGIFEGITDFSDIFYDDSVREEINFTAKIKIRIKATIDLNDLNVKDFYLLNFDILHINVTREDIQEYIGDIVNDYYTFEPCGIYELQCVFIARLIEKGFEL